jgi:hypothetical protein
MALRTPPSWLQNGSHPAENDRLSMQAIIASTGIIGSSSCAVTQNSPTGMSVLVAAGWGAIVGTTQANMGVYQFYNDASTVATITTANPSNPRIDRVCITVSDAYYTGALNQVAINVVAGTPAVSPVAPATPANSISLATIAVGAGVTSITNANITDTRVNVTTNLPVGDITEVQGGTGISVASGTGPIPVVSLDGTVVYGYTTTATAAGTTVLTAASTSTQFFTGVTTQTITLPVASTMVLGENYAIHNNSTGALTVNSSGGNLVATIPAGNTWLITCILTSGTTAASWDADFTGTTSTTGSGSTVLATSPTITTPVIDNGVLKSPEERYTVSATAATGVIAFNTQTQGVLYYTTNASANFTLNFTNVNANLSVGDSISCVFLNTNGATAYYASAFQIDSVAVTPKWSGGTAPTAGNINSIDAYSFTIIKTAATPTYIVLAGGAVKFA